MPKDVIKTRNEGFNLEVRWAPDREIQVGVMLDPKTSDQPQTLQELFNGRTDDIPEHQGLFVTFDWLDRAAINRLIRSLRKARDSAFGRDE